MLFSLQHTRNIFANLWNLTYSTSRTLEPYIFGLNQSENLMFSCSEDVSEPLEPYIYDVRTLCFWFIPVREPYVWIVTEP